TAGYNGENIAATDAQLFNPNGVAIDGAGNIYIVDYSNSRIRKVNTSGFIATIAGNGTAGYSGDNFAATAAELRPLGIAVDGSGNVYIGDANNDAVRKINTTGVITTIAGTGVGGFSGDGGPANMAQLHGPVGVAIDNEGSMYIGDAANNRIRYIRSTVFVNQISGITDAMHVYPNPSSGIFTINIVSGNEANVRLCITNVTGEKVKEIMAVTNTPVDVKLDVPDGIYFLTAITTQGLLNQKIVLRAESP
ncbi:MAG TPA: T9SS type A sorting domain-containing protein, partial [Ferruginibacter sp.]|nr:T9SS type A sorting domain-containing protein [Ferruginibacter sp.]